MAPVFTGSLVCAGNLVVDDIVLPDGTRRDCQAGGAVLYAALGAALWGAPVVLVAPVGDDYPNATLSALEAWGPEGLLAATPERAARRLSSAQEVCSNSAG